MVDMAVGEQDLFDRDARRRDGLLDPVEIASRIDHGGPFRGLAPHERAILLERGDGHDGGADRRQGDSRRMLRWGGVQAERGPLGEPTDAEAIATRSMVCRPLHGTETDRRRVSLAAMLEHAMPRDIRRALSAVAILGCVAGPPAQAQAGRPWVDPPASPPQPAEPATPERAPPAAAPATPATREAATEPSARAKSQRAERPRRSQKVAQAKPRRLAVRARPARRTTADRSRAGTSALTAREGVAAGLEVMTLRTIELPDGRRMNILVRPDPQTVRDLLAAALDRSPGNRPASPAPHGLSLGGALEHRTRKWTPTFGIHRDASDLLKQRIVDDAKTGSSLGRTQQLGPSEDQALLTPRHPRANAQRARLASRQA